MIRALSFYLLMFLITKWNETHVIKTIYTELSFQLGFFTYDQNKILKIVFISIGQNELILIEFLGLRLFPLNQLILIVKSRRVDDISLKIVGSISLDFCRLAEYMSRNLLYYVYICTQYPSICSISFSDFPNNFWNYTFILFPAWKLLEFKQFDCNGNFV